MLEILIEAAVAKSQSSAEKIVASKTKKTKKKIGQPLYLSPRQ